MNVHLLLHHKRARVRLGLAGYKTGSLSVQLVNIQCT